MSDTPQILLAHHLKALKLPTFLREYDKVARLCAAEGVDHPRYLMRLAEMEMPGGYRPPVVDFCAHPRAGASGAWSSGVLSGRDQASIAPDQGRQVPRDEEPPSQRCYASPAGQWTASTSLLCHR